MRETIDPTRKRVMSLLEASDPLAGRDPASEGVRDALDQMADAITRRPRSEPSRDHGRRRVLARPRGLLAVGATLLLLAGGATAATKLLTAETGTYAHGWEIKAGGPGENLRLAGSDFCRVALRLSSQVPYPPGFADWRPWVLVAEEGVPRVTASGSCGSRNQSRHAQVTSGALRGFFAMSAFCAWVYDWRDAMRAGDGTVAERAAAEVNAAPGWNAVRAEDQHLTAGPLHATRYGLQGEHSLFGWFLPFKEAVSRGDVTTVGRLIASNYGTAGCPYFRPPAASHGGTVNPLLSSK
jgi:hypothetical protein